MNTTGKRQQQRNIWIISFADLSCLLLAFFVLLYSMSTLDSGAWPSVSAALSQQRDITTAPPATVATARYNIASAIRARAINLDYLHAVLRDILAANAALASAQLELRADRLVIRLPVDSLFASHSAKIGARAETAVFALGGVLGNITNPIAVVADAGSEWELAVARAAAFADVLSRSGYTRDITALGAAGATNGVTVHILAGGGG